MVLEVFDLRSLFLKVFRLLCLDFSGTCFHQWVNRAVLQTSSKKVGLEKLNFLFPSLLWSSVCEILKDPAGLLQWVHFTPKEQLLSACSQATLLSSAFLCLQVLPPGWGTFKAEITGQRTRRGSCAVGQKRGRISQPSSETRIKHSCNRYRNRYKLSMLCI